MRPSPATVAAVGDFSNDTVVEIRRQSRRAAAVSVRITQDSTQVLDAQVWFSIPSEVVQYDHTPDAPAPRVARQWLR